MIKVNKKELREALKHNKTACWRAGTMPILGNARLQFQDGELVVTTTDLDTEVVTWIPVLETEGKVSLDTTVPLHLLEKVASGKKGGTIDIQLQDGKVKAGIALLPTIPSEEFPEGFNCTKKGGKAEDPCRTIEAIRDVAFAVCTEEARHNLNGVCLTPSGDVVATDGHRLALSRTGAKIRIKENVIVPRSSLKALLALKTPCRMAVHKQVPIVKGERVMRKQVLVVKGERARVAIRLVDGTFPDYYQIVPDEGSSGLALEVVPQEWREPLSEALRILKGECGLPGVNLCFNEASAGEASTVRIHRPPRDDEPGVDLELPAIYHRHNDNKLEKFGIDLRYLLDVVNAENETENVKFEFSEEISPILVTGCLTQVVMPVRV